MPRLSLALYRANSALSEHNRRRHIWPAALGRALVPAGARSRALAVREREVTGKAAGTIGTLADVSRANGVIGLANRPDWTSAEAVDVARTRWWNDAFGRAGGTDGEMAGGGETGKVGGTDLKGDGAGVLKIVADDPAGNATRARAGTKLAPYARKPRYAG